MARVSLRTRLLTKRLNKLCPRWLGLMAALAIALALGGCSEPRRPAPSAATGAETSGVRDLPTALDQYDVTCQDAPSGANLWQATNPDARDFRLETLGAQWRNTPLTALGAGPYVFTVKVAPPRKGWTAFLVELTFPSGCEVEGQMAARPEQMAHGSALRAGKAAPFLRAPRLPRSRPICPPARPAPRSARSRRSGPGPWSSARWARSGGGRAARGRSGA